MVQSPVVVGSRADPEPDERVVFTDAECAPVETNPNQRDRAGPADLFELQAGVVRILHPHHNVRLAHRNRAGLARLLLPIRRHVRMPASIAVLANLFLEDCVFQQTSRRRLLVSGASLFGVVALAACSAPVASPTAAPAKPVQTAAAKPTAGAATKPAEKAATGATAAPKRTQIVKLKYQTPTQLSFSWIPDYLTVKGGFYEKEMLDVEIIGGTGSAAVYQQMIAKNIDFGRGSGIFALTAADREPLPTTSVMAIHRQMQLNVLVMKDGPVKEPKDLKGKVIGVASRGGAAEQVAILLAAAGGLKRDDFRTEVTGAGLGGYGLMEQGKVDAYVASDSAEVTLLSQNKPIKIFKSSEYFKMPSDDYVFTNDRLKSDPELVVSVLRAVHTARTFTLKKENWDKAIEWIAAYIPDEVSDKDLAHKKLEKQIALWTNDGKDVNRMGFHEAENWTGGAKALHDAGFNTKLVDPSQLWTNDFVEKATKA